MINQETFEAHLKRTTIISNVLSIVVALLVAMSVGYGFYYNTKNTLDEHSEDITEIKDDVNSITLHINEIDVFKGVSSTEIKAIEEKVDKNLKEIEKMDDKLDKILIQTKQ